MTHYSPDWLMILAIASGGFIWALSIVGLVCLFSGPPKAQPCDVQFRHGNVSELNFNLGE